VKIKGRKILYEKNNNVDYNSVDPAVVSVEKRIHFQAFFHQGSSGDTESWEGVRDMTS
jgi:hypothetical protein